MKNPLFISIPHSGEQIPEEANWLRGLPETIQMCDVDRYVDVLYTRAIQKLNLPSIIAKWHRYAVDLNRSPEDIDEASVQGAKTAPGEHPTGFHWSVTTQGDSLMRAPITQSLHQKLTQKYWKPFHAEVKAKYNELEVAKNHRVFQIDAHSMPSKGTNKHRDPGQLRAEVVISDQDGKSCDSDFRDLVVEGYKQAGFEVKLNWPYLGGRITQTYGKPTVGQNCIQVELNRSLYMNEDSKLISPPGAKKISEKLEKALQIIRDGLETL